MKRLGFWTTAVVAILLVVPIARASAAERPSYWQAASVMATSSKTVGLHTEAAVQSGWTDQDTVEETGIGVLALLGAAALATLRLSARSTLDSKAREREDAERRRRQQRDELLRNTLDEILATVDTYLLLRKPGETAEKSVVQEVLAGLYRLEGIAGDPPAKYADGFRNVVTIALTSDLDVHEGPDAISHDAASLSKRVHRMADRLREEIQDQSRPVQRAA